MDREKSLQFLSSLKDASFATGDVIDLPSVSLLDDVFKEMRARILARYENVSQDQPQRQLSLEERFRQSLDGFNGTWLKPKIKIHKPDLSFIQKLKDSQQIDRESAIQFEVSAHPHVTGYGDIGDVTRQFVLFARQTQTGPQISLLSGVITGKAPERFKTIMQVSKGTATALELDRRSVAAPRAFTGGGLGKKRG